MLDFARVTKKALGLDPKEGPRPMQPIQPAEIDISTIHDIDRTRFYRQQIQHVDIVKFAVGDVNKAWNAAT